MDDPRAFFVRLKYVFEKTRSVINQSLSSTLLCFITCTEEGCGQKKKKGVLLTHPLLVITIITYFL